MRALRFAVVGDPIAHSKSPAMHGAAFAELGLPHTYEAVRVAPAELEAIVRRLRDGEFDGLNVTVPHKEAVLAFVDELDESARCVGAANTLVRNERRIVAYNTDGVALAQELAMLRGRVVAVQSTDDATRPSALVLGAGGAARAAVFALVHRLGVARVVLRSRRFAESAVASAFVREMLRIHGSGIEFVAQPLVAAKADGAKGERDFAFVVQATKAGMVGEEDGERVAGAVDWNTSLPGAVAIDVVYAPPKTPFVEAAERAGLPHANGMGMLARQGAVAFELWIGTPAPLEAMLRAIG